LLRNELKSKLPNIHRAGGPKINLSSSVIFSRRLGSTAIPAKSGFTAFRPALQNKIEIAQSSLAMNSITFQSLRLVTLTTALFVLPLISAKAPSAAPDLAASALARVGSIPVKTAHHDEFGDSVGIGSSPNLVIFRLGKPNVMLRDGTWMYRGCTVDLSEGTGTLVISFSKNRISQLTLVTPAVELAMRNGNDHRESSKALVASASSR
jgi:hypothetical protein